MASESYLMGSTQNEWAVFSYGISDRTASVFPPELPPNMKRTHLGHTLFAVSEAEGTVQALGFEKQKHV